MNLQDFCDMGKFEEIMRNWAQSTDFATVAVSDDVLKLPGQEKRGKGRSEWNETGLSDFYS